MYLKATRFLWTEERKNLKIENILGVIPEHVTYIEQEACYWRKANMIHNWFVQNVQEGVDDCKDYEVTRDKIKELIELCKSVLKDKSSANIILPARGGFFFGSTAYDEFYFKDLEYTVETLTKALELPKEWDFEYHSSW